MAKRKPTPTPAHITLATPQQVAAVADLWQPDDWETVPGQKARGLHRLKTHPEFVISRRQYDKYYTEDKRIYIFGKHAETQWTGQYFKSRENLEKRAASLHHNMLIWVSAHGITNVGLGPDYSQLGWYTILPPTKQHSFSIATMDTNEKRIFASVTYDANKRRYLLRWKEPRNE